MWPVKTGLSTGRARERRATHAGDGGYGGATSQQGKEEGKGLARPVAHPELSWGGGEVGDGPEGSVSPAAELGLQRRSRGRRRRCRALRLDSSGVEEAGGAAELPTLLVSLEELSIDGDEAAELDGHVARLRAQGREKGIEGKYLGEREQVRSWGRCPSRRGRSGGGPGAACIAGRPRQQHGARRKERDDVLQITPWTTFSIMDRSLSKLFQNQQQCQRFY